MATALALPAATPADFVALTKPRIVLMVVVTAGAGFVLGARTLAPGAWPASSTGALAWVMLHALAGTALVAGGTSAMNQVLERDVDARMRRTARRPLPAGRLTPRQAWTFAWAISLLGVLELARFTNATTALLAAATLASYVFAYTPLKRHTPLATLVGAVPGALPIVGGWTAAGAPLDARAGALFAVLFLWQLPHVLALGWLHRDDYARAGLRMPSVDDPDGWATFRLAAITAAGLLPVSLAPAALLRAGPAYLAVALVLSLALLGSAVAAARAPTPAHARRLFLATLAWLPALLVTLVLTARHP